MRTLAKGMAGEMLRRLLRDLHAEGRIGGCRILSEGAECDCALCLLDAVEDKNTAELIALRAERDALRAEVTDWILVADGVKHDWRCCHGEAGMGLCLRCRAEKAEAQLADLTAEVRKLPEPIVRVPMLVGGRWMDGRKCQWCHVEMVDPSATWHPDNGCLALLRETTGEMCWRPVAVWAECQLDVSVQCTACSAYYVAPNPDATCPLCGAVRRAIADDRPERREP